MYTYMARKLGLDKPVFYMSWGVSAESRYLPLVRWHGFDNQFHHYCLHIIRGDLGKSFIDEQPVWDKIRTPLSISLVLGILTLIFSFLMSILLAIVLARWHGRRREKWLSAGLSLLYAIPTFLLALIAVVFFTNDRYGLKIASVGLANRENLGFWYWLFVQIPHLWLPVFCLSAHIIAKLTKQIHIALINILAENFISTAYSKGLTSFQVLIRHALPSATYVLVAALGNLSATVLMGSLVIEVIFNIMGIGRLSYEAILVRDYTVIMGVFWCAALTTLIGNLLADIFHQIFYPFKKLEIF
jgi:ABC-type dipeptide/oligopeptide/nickel transport system permease component